MKKSVLFDAAKYVLGIVLLGYILWKYWKAPAGGESLGLRDLVRGPIRVRALLLAGVLCSCSVLLTFIRWFVLVRAQGLPFRVIDAIRLGLVGFFFNTFLPGSVGGDLIKMAFVAREQSRRTVAVATVLLDRAVGLLGLFTLVGLVGGCFWLSGDPSVRGQPYLEWVICTCGLMSCGVLTCWLVLSFLPDYRAERFAGRLTRIPKLGVSVSEFWRAVWMYHRRRAEVILALGLALLGHVGFVLTFYFASQIFQAVNPETLMLSLGEHFIFVPVAMTIQAFFPTPGGIGGGEAAYAGLYKLLGGPPIIGAAGSLAQRLLACLIGFVGYIVYLQMRPAMPKEQEARELAVAEV